ncbi:MAG: ribosome maturation factor RimM [Acetivibrionales bacterium]|jgi:16S rRNA processing protein RimM
MIEQIPGMISGDFDYEEVISMVNEYLIVGTVINTHGVKGELKVNPITSDVSRFDYLTYVSIKRGSEFKEYRVLSRRYHKGFVLLLLKGIETMDEAEKLKGMDLYVARKHAIELEEDEFFMADIIGLEVYEGEKRLGILTDILETGSNDVYIITDDNKKELLIPALKSVVKVIDIEERVMQVILPEGLTDEV